MTQYEAIIFTSPTSPNSIPYLATKLASHSDLRSSSTDSFISTCEAALAISSMGTLSMNWEQIVPFAKTAKSSTDIFTDRVVPKCHGAGSTCDHLWSAGNKQKCSTSTEAHCTHACAHTHHPTSKTKAQARLS